MSAKFLFPATGRLTCLNNMTGLKKVLFTAIVNFHILHELGPVGLPSLLKDSLSQLLEIRSHSSGIKKPGFLAGLLGIGTHT